MNNKSLVLGIVLFGAGVGAGYILGINVVKNRYKEDLAEVKDFYRQKLDELGVEPEGFTPPTDDDEAEDSEFSEEISEEYFSKLSGYSSAATKPSEGQRGKGKPIYNYSKPPLEMVAHGALQEADPDQDPDDESPHYDDAEYEAELEARADELAAERERCKSDGRPYTINHDEYEDLPEGFTRQVLYYYNEDRVLCEDDDSIVENEEELVGFEYEDILDMQTTAWVRNDNIMTAYQIHRIDQSYAEAVTNVRETPSERNYRIIGRRKQGFDS